MRRDHLMGRGWEAEMGDSQELHLAALFAVAEVRCLYRLGSKTPLPSLPIHLCVSGAPSPSLQSPPTMEATLFGYALPFPREDLFVALGAVLLFIPAVVILNALAHGVINLFSSSKKAKAA